MSITVNGCAVGVNLPKAPEGDGVHGLPPHCHVDLHSVDEYPACPANWMHGSGIAGSYFFAVEEGKHLWLDFNGNRCSDYHYAIVISVQGINPVTGQPLTALRLEEYAEKCPIHGQEFKAERYCAACAYRWPKQNFLSTKDTPEGLWWIDGWRIAGDRIRGFLIKPEDVNPIDAVGIASQKIGDDRSFAVGVAFYRSKEKRPPRLQRVIRTNSLSQPFGALKNVKRRTAGGSGQSVYRHMVDYNDVSHHLDSPKATWQSTNGTQASLTNNPRGMELASFAAEPAALETELKTSGSIESIDVTKMEVAAGAVISQRIYDDALGIVAYEEQPMAMMYLNYCTAADLQRIIKAGKRRDKQDGPLAGLAVGN
jgi:hypothetical protein